MLAARPLTKSNLLSAIVAFLLVAGGDASFANDLPASLTLEAGTTAYLSPANFLELRIPYGDASRAGLANPPSHAVSVLRRTSDSSAPIVHDLVRNVEARVFVTSTTMIEVNAAHVADRRFRSLTTDQNERARRVFGLIAGMALVRASETNFVYIGTKVDF